MSAALPSPYKGLVPYDENDAPFFFGRAAETEIISANLIASRLTLLYGASGVGKSSVLHAGVAHSLRQLAQANLTQNGKPEFVVLVFSAWRDDPVLGLQTRIQEAVGDVYGAQKFEPLAPTRSLSDCLNVWSERIEGDILVILDQFEEYFLYHGLEDGEGSFAVEFPRAVNRRGLRANFLISIREDALARLDFFKGRIPNLFDNYLRIQHLDRDAARAAIEKPLAVFNAQVSPAQQVTIEPALVTQIIDQLEEGKVLLSDAGRGGVKADDAQSRIETPYLQLVMTRLWNEERRAGSQTLRLDTLTKLGGPERIVRTHLDEAMSALPTTERDIAASLFRYLVTPSGTKIAYSASDIAVYVQLPKERVAPVLEKLAGAVRILRPLAPPPGQPQVVRYEIFHDVLAAAILDWRQRYEQAKLKAAQEARAHRQRRIALAVAFVTVLIVIGLVYLWQSSAAQAAKNAQQVQIVSNLFNTAVPQDQPTQGLNGTSLATQASNVDARATINAALTSVAPNPQQISILPSATPTPAPPTPSPTQTLTPDAGKTADALLTLAATIRPTPTTTPTSTSTLTPTPTPIPPTPIPPTPTPTEVPRLIVTKIEMIPADPRRNQEIVFNLTFHNSYPTSQTFAWSLWIYSEDNSKNPTWRSDNNTKYTTFQPGDTVVTTYPTWRVQGTGGPVGFNVFVRFINPDGSFVRVLNADGNDASIFFVVAGAGS